MTDKEILANAIDKAIANGYKLQHPVHDNKSITEFIQQSYEMVDSYPYMDIVVYMPIIFSHSFLKAFFDKDIYVHWDESNPELEDLKSYKEIPQGEIHLIYLFPEGDYHWYQPLWAYHAQVMILKENPITYLEEYL